MLKFMSTFRTFIGWLFSLSTVATLLGLIALNPLPMIAPYWLMCFGLATLSGGVWFVLNCFMRTAHSEPEA